MTASYPARRASANAERRRLKGLWPDEFAHGEKRGFHRLAGYPVGFSGWPLDRRNGFFAGFNFGRSKRLQAQGGQR